MAENAVEGKGVGPVSEVVDEPIFLPAGIQDWSFLCLLDAHQEVKAVVEQAVGEGLANRFDVG
jgi:hypothetical protein